MSHDNSYILIIIGAFFLILCAICLWEAGSEDRRLNDSLSRRIDVRAFMLGPIHIEATALRVGGYIFLVLALISLIMGGVYLAI